MRRKFRNERFFAAFFILFFWNLLALGQTSTNEKQISHFSQSWFSVNSTMRFSDHWGLMADFHFRKEFFFKDDFFYFARLGAVTWINGKYPLAYGIARLWLAPKPGGTTWSNENRFYQQWSATHKEGIVSVLHRIRTEQRWRDVIINDQKTGDKLFSFRLRYLASFDARIFRNNKLPSLVLSDEILVQFGKDIVFNTFDQNRLFLGLKLPIKSNLSFDIGYMKILQQKSTGYKYDSSNVFRLFFYYTPDFRKQGAGDAISLNNMD
jgi:hypothetical protein